MYRKAVHSLCCMLCYLQKDLDVPRGHVQKCRDKSGSFVFAGPGMHNVKDEFFRTIGNAQKIKGEIELQHGTGSGFQFVENGDNCICVVNEGYVGYAMDKGRPVLLSPGLHQWKSDTLYFKRAIPLDDHVVEFGPYTLITVDEGYAAVTQDNGRMIIIDGGQAALLTHKNWKFEQFLSLKIQTDDLAQINATSADNITMQVTSTVSWRITNVKVAAERATATQATSKQKTTQLGLAGLRVDVLKQALASLAAFVGTVKYADSFTPAAALAKADAGGIPPVVVDGVMIDPATQTSSAVQLADNPLFDTGRLDSAVSHANKVTEAYGVEILAINIISALPTDPSLVTALAAGAVAAAQALQAETVARATAKGRLIEVQAENEAVLREAKAHSDAKIIQAQADAQATELRADADKKAADLLATSDVAVKLAMIDRSASAIGASDKFFFGADPEWLSSVILNGDNTLVNGKRSTTKR